MQHAIVGAGLIGSFIGGVLAINGQSVTAIARGEWASRLAKRVLLTDYKEHRAEAAFEAVFTDSTDAKPVDVIWLTVKCTAVEAALPSLTALLAPHTTIICCQNGIGSERLVRQAYPDHQVLKAMVPFNVVLEAPQHLHKGSEGKLVIATPAQQQQTVELGKALSHALIEVEFTHDITAVSWAKLQLNLGNSVNALADMPVKTMLEDRSYRRVIAALMDELLLVTRSAGIHLPKITRLPAAWLPTVLRLPDWLFKRVARTMLEIDPSVKTSMWWDLQGKRKTEIDYLNGAVVRLGEDIGVACPANRAIMRAIEGAEKENAASGHYKSYAGMTLLTQVRRAG